MMPVNPRPYELLESRLRAFTRTLPRLSGLDARTSSGAWVAARRLRELVPVLPIAAEASEKIIGRLRRHLRRVEAVRQSDRLLALVDQIEAAERRKRAVLPRLRDDLAESADLARADLTRRRATHEAARVASKLADLAHTMREAGADRKRIIAIRWAVRARVARRASDLMAAIDAAGSVYLPQRLEAVHAAVRKLHYGAELASEVGAHVAPADLRMLARIERLLVELSDRQALVVRVRHLQGGLATPDLKAWRDFDTVLLAAEHRNRDLHASYVNDRVDVVGVCERLLARAASEGRTRRKVS